MGLTVDTDGGVQTWHLEFPPVNAIDPDFLQALEGQLSDTETDTAVAVVILASSLRVFSAGADAKWMAGVVEEEGEQALLHRFNVAMDRFRELCLRIRRSPILFVAAVGGHALAGGLELIAACDLRYVAADDRIQIGASEMKFFGVLPSGGGGTQYLARLMGPSRCLEFVLRAENCSPKQALQLGLADRLLPPESLISDTQAFARALASKAGRIGINAAKRAILDGSSLGMSEAIELDRAVHWDSMRRGGFLPGLTEFVARFGGRQAR